MGCVISNDENLIASCSYDKTVRIWDMKSFDCVKIFKLDNNVSVIKFE
jgi:WD40 repeat protein